MATRSSVNLPYIGDGQFIRSETVSFPVSGVTYERQVVVIGDPDNPNNYLSVQNGALPVSATDLDIRNLSGATDTVNISNLTGTPFYQSGTGGGTVTVAAGRRVCGITALAVGADGTITINGGNVITVRAGSTFSYNPNGNLVAPTIVFSGSLDYFVEGVS